MLTLAQLRTLYTDETALEDILDVLTAAEFEVGSWQSGAIRRTILQGLAKFLVVLSPFVDALSRIHFNSESSENALTNLSRDNFGNTRIAAVATIGVERFTGGAVGPPYTIAAGKAVVSDGSLTFRNSGAYYSAGVRVVGDFTIPAGGYVDAEVYCETPGKEGDVANGSITTLVTTYAGVTVSNPAFGSSGTWITTHGADEESDDALRARNASEVGQQALIATIDDRYENLAREVLANARVRVDSANPRGPGTIDVWVAGPSGVATPTERTAVETKIDASGFGDGTEVYAAVVCAVNVAGTIYYVGTLAAVQTAVTAALQAYIDAAPLGGYDLTPGPANIIPRDGLEDAIRGATGVRGVNLTAGETTPTTYQVADLGTESWVWVAVTA